MRGWSIFFDRNETAAIFVASGQGLMDVNIPNHNAESKAIIIDHPPADYQGILEFHFLCIDRIYPYSLITAKPAQDS